MKKSGNKQLTADLLTYYNYLLKNYVEAFRLKHRAKNERREPLISSSVYDSTIEGKHEKQFKARVDYLYDCLKTKFEHRNDVEIPEEIRKKLEKNDVYNLSFEEAAELLNCVQTLLEKIGYTTLEQEEWVENEITMD